MNMQRHVAGFLSLLFSSLLFAFILFFIFIFLLITANFPCGPALGAHIDINCVLLVQFLLVAHSCIGYGAGAGAETAASLTNVGQLICLNSIIALIFYRIKAHRASELADRGLCSPSPASWLTSKEDARHSWRPAAGSSHS